MDKTQYLEALKRAMTGLPPEAQARTLAFYEQRFVDGVAAGRTEAEIAAEQDDPTKIAMTLRANTHMQSFAQKKNPASTARTIAAAIGLAIFNLFMVVPAMVYAALLSALYITGVAFYLSGTVITGSGLSGNNEIRLDGPFNHVSINDDGVAVKDGSKTKVDISEQGIHISSDEENEAVDIDVTANPSVTVGEPALDDVQEPKEKGAVRAIKRAEAVAADGIVLYSGDDDDSHATQIFVGIGLILGGIILLLLALTITRYTAIGIRRYFEMNFALLKGN
jgi:uncharacterized membrane protein